MLIPLVIHKELENGLDIENKIHLGYHVEYHLYLIIVDRHWIKKSSIQFYGGSVDYRTLLTQVVHFLLIATVTSD